MSKTRPLLKDIQLNNFDLPGAGQGCSCGAFIYSQEQLIGHLNHGCFDIDNPPPALSIHIQDGMGSQDKVGG